MVGRHRDGVLLLLVLVADPRVYILTERGSFGGGVKIGCGFQAITRDYRLL